MLSFCLNCFRETETSCTFLKAVVWDPSQFPFFFFLYDQHTKYLHFLNVGNSELLTVLLTD